VQKLDHLQRLGVTVIEVMPLAEFAGALSWGYNASCVFAVETNYGGGIGFKRFVKTVHRAGMSVILDVVYNHFVPTDLDLWQFDGWSESGMGGIYFLPDGWSLVQADNVIAYHRLHQGGPGDDVGVVVNLSHLAHENYKLGFPSPGTWRLRLNSDWKGYSRGFGNQACSDVVARTERRDKPEDQSAGQRDGFPASATIRIGPYSVLIFSQDKPRE